MTRDDRPPALVCRQTGSIRSVAPCMAAPDGGCDYCSLPAPEASQRIRVDALAHGWEQAIKEAYR